MHHFDNVGLYDALFVMQDRESKTLWNHITGEALYGPMVGRSLGPVSNVLQMNVTQALVLDGDLRVAISDRAYFAGGRQFGTAAGFGGGRGRASAPPGAARGAAARGGGRGGRGLDPDASLMDMFVETLGQEDTRRPRMDMGLGVWTGSVRRYYPMEVVRERGAFFDEIDSRRALVYLDPDTFTPAAVFVDSTTARLEGADVLLDGGRLLRAGVLFERDGRRVEVERPQQVFTRWYGFALTFPGTEIFEQ